MSKPYDFEKPKNTKFGKYKYVESIGAGNEGEVYKVQFKDTYYALKKPKKKYELNKALLLKLKVNENLCRFCDCFEDQTNQFEVYEYCNGGNLTQRLEKQKFDQNSTLNFLRQLCNGYKELYTNNIIHRDLKPDNILYHNEVVKIADYGFARFVPDPEVMDHFTKKCTPLFGAPQIFESPYSSKCDVWSVGIILYKMIFKVYPNEGIITFDQLTEFYQKVKANKLPYPKNEMPLLVQLVKQMIRYSENDRIGWPQLFTHPLIVGDSIMQIQQLPNFNHFTLEQITELFQFKINQINCFLDLMRNNDKIEQLQIIVSIWQQYYQFLLSYLKGQTVVMTIDFQNFNKFQQSKYSKKCIHVLNQIHQQVNSQIDFLKSIQSVRKYSLEQQLNQQKIQPLNLNQDIKQLVEYLDIQQIQKQQLLWLFQPI